MKLEKFKTILLVALIASSIFLSFQLFVIRPEKQISYTENVQFDENIYELVKDLVTPERIIFNYSEENHKVFYSDFGMDLWKNTRDIFQSSFFDEEIAIKEISNEEYLEKLGKKSIVYKFEAEIPIELLFELNKSDSILKLEEHVETINEVYIGLSGNNEILLKNPDKTFSLSINKIDNTFLLNKMEEGKSDEFVKYRTGKVISAPENILIPINSDQTQSNIYVANEIDVSKLKPIEEIVKNFFNDVETARKIEENDGSLIYMYDRKGLVFTDEGVLKYFDEIKAPVEERDLYKCLLTFAMFSNSYGYGPQDIYLSNIEEIQSGSNQGYKLSFNYRINRKKVILKNTFSTELRLPVEVEVYNDYIKSYKRYYRERASLDTLDSFSFSIDYIMNPLDIINENLNLIRYNYMQENKLSIEDMQTIDNRPILGSIKEITSAYYDYCENGKNSKLVEVWVVKIGSHEYIFDAYKGKLVKQIR